MLDQHWTLPSPELDEFPPSEQAVANHQTLVIAACFAVLLHLVALAYWPSASNAIPRSSSLKISLVKSPVPDKPAVEEKTGPIQPETIGPYLDTQLPVSKSAREKQNHALTEMMPTTTGTSLFHRAIEIIRKKTMKKKTEYRSFSTQDFPATSTANPFQPVEYLPVMISQPRTVEMTDSNGYTTILRTDGFGKSRCMQQRGFKGDGNPPMWYMVPAATCGHLKDKK